MKHSSLLICVLLVNVHFSYNKLIRRYLFSGVLFEDEDMLASVTVDFADTNKDEWKNLTAMAIKHKLRGKEMFCSVGTGGWIGYPKEAFSHDGMFYQLIIGDVCTPADLLNSIQPIGFVFANQAGVVSLFSKPHFASEAKLIYKGTSSGDFKSLIYWGFSGATLEGTGKNGKVKYCLYRSMDEAKVCILPDLASEMGLTSSQITVKLGCDFSKDKDLKLFFMQTCFDDGVEQVPIAWDMKTTAMLEICKGSGKQDDKNIASVEFARVMDVWKSRILYESESFGRTQLNNLEDSPKVDAFLQFLDIFVDGCPYVSPHYLSLLGQVYLNHLKDAWKVRPPTNFDPSDTFDYLSHCWAAVKDNANDFVVHATCSPRGIGFEGHLLFESETFDTVIEQIWLMLNFVAPFCSQLGDYTTNQWMEFPDIFKTVFLKPLEAQWINPGVWERIYPIMFHGYDIRDQSARVLACVHGGLDLVPHMDPVGRTSGFNNILFGPRNRTLLVPETQTEPPRTKRGGDFGIDNLKDIDEVEKRPEEMEERPEKLSKKKHEKKSDQFGKENDQVSTKAKNKKRKKSKSNVVKEDTKIAPKENQDNQHLGMEKQDKNPNSLMTDAQDKSVTPKKNHGHKKNLTKERFQKDKKKPDKDISNDGSLLVPASNGTPLVKGSHSKGRSQSLKPKKIPK